MNVKFTYLYCDAGNYKYWGEVVFENPDGLAVVEINERLVAAFEQEIFFIAHQVGIAEMFPYLDGNISDEDHCYHEYESVEETDEVATDSKIRSIDKFVVQVENAATHGWRAFNPEYRVSESTLI